MSDNNGSGVLGAVLAGASIAGLILLFAKLHRRLVSQGPLFALIFSAIVFAAGAIAWPYLDAWSQEAPLGGVMAPLTMVFSLVPAWLLWMLAASSLMLLMLRLSIVPTHTQE
jgi:hypothetical protein